MMAKIFISGSISLKTLDVQAVTHLDSIMAYRHTVLIGDAHGIDKVVQQYLLQNRYQAVIVYYSGDKIRNNIGNWETKQTGNDSHLTGRELYRLKDDTMAQDADYGLMIWDGKSRGTKYNMENMTKLDKPFTVLGCMDIPQDVFIRYVESGNRMDKRHVLSLLIDICIWIIAV
jgi:hypothetical protein